MFITKTLQKVLEKYGGGLKEVRPFERRQKIIALRLETGL